MLRVSSVLLLVSSAAAAAVVPSKETDANNTARLEALVRDMATGQGTAAAAPTPHWLSDDVVILEGGEKRRRLGRCTCALYRNGATPNAPVCNKMESGIPVCYPTSWDGSCGDSDATLCGANGGGPIEAVEEAPTFFDDEDSNQVFLNVNLQLSNAATTSAAQMPTNDQFVHALSLLTDISENRINGVASFGAPVSVMSAKGDGSSGTTATLRASLRLNSPQKRDATEALILTSEELPEIGSRSFSIVFVDVLDQMSQPLVCSPLAETIKAESSVYLNQLLALQQAEAALVGQGASQHTPVFETEVLYRLAATLGVQVSAASRRA